MSKRWIAAIGVAAAAVLGLAAVATAPDDTPDVGALPQTEPSAPQPTSRPAGPSAPQPTSRPAGPTGKPGGPDAPSFDGALTAAQVPVLRPAPDLDDLDGWLQTEHLTDLADLHGSVVVLQFWTFSCSNCKATIPNLQALRDAHAQRDDFTIIGVHYPEFPFEEDPDAVAAAAAELGVTWPIALDTDGTNFHRWQEGSSGYWPRTYVLDRGGNIRFDHVGEGRYDELNATVAALLEDDST